MCQQPELEPVFIIVERAKIRGTPVMEKHLLPGLQLTYGLCWWQNVDLTVMEDRQNHDPRHGLPELGEPQQ